MISWNISTNNIIFHFKEKFDFHLYFTELYTIIYKKNNIIKICF